MAVRAVTQQAEAVAEPFVPPAIDPIWLRIGRRLTSDTGIRVLTFIGVITTWELLGLVMSRVTFASASRTFAALLSLWSSGELPSAWATDLGMMFTGLAIAATSGIALGLLFGRLTTLDRFFEPVMNGLFMTPKIALLPIIALWLGYQSPAKIVVIFLFSFFEIFFTIRNGVKAIDREYVDVARAYNIPEGEMMRKIVLPATLPFVMTGLRLGLLHGMVGVVLAGFFLENIGIGGLINNYASSFRLAPVFAVMITVMLVGVTMNVGLTAMQRRLAPWSEGRSL